MYSYFAYGLGIQSELPLPELNAAIVEKDIDIRIRKLESISLSTSDDLPYFKINPNEIILSIEKTGTFVIQNGNVINVDPATNVDECLLRRYIIGTVMALLLYQRGLLVLHASAININGFAVAFLGYPGSGKSSIIAALHRNGHEIITDDVSAISFFKKSIKVFPGFSQIKLSDEVSKILGFDINSSIKLDEQEEKRGYRVKDKFATTPIELRQIYILKNATSQGIQHIAPQEAVKELIKHSYPTRFARDGNPEHFLMCVNLANKVPLFHLNRTSSLPTLPMLAQLVEDNLV